MFAILLEVLKEVFYLVLILGGGMLAACVLIAAACLVEYLIKKWRGKK